MTEQLGDVAKEVKRHRPGGQKDSIAKRLMAAVAASAASAASAYAVKKGPELFREKVLPKIREKGGVEKLAQDLFQRAKAVVESASPIELPGMTSDGRSATARGRTSARRAMSNEQRKKERQGRAARRRARRQALSR